MFFAITALGVSAVQIVIGIAIGMSLRKTRQRQRMNSDAPTRVEVRDQAGERPRASQPDKPSPPSDETSTQGHDRDGVIRSVPENSKEVESAAKDAAQPVTTSDRQPESEAPPHTITEPAKLPEEANRRRSPRRDFEFRQHVAPYHGGMLPGKASFREVECQDISSTGFSFLSSQIPDFNSVVVALGVAPRQVYLWAEIVNRFQLGDGPAPLYRIGCRFVGQVSQ